MQKRHLASFIALAGVPFGLAHAQQAPSTQDALTQWRAEYGSNWQVDLDEGTGRAEFLFGGKAPAVLEPVVEADWFTLARQALANAQNLHGIEQSTLVEASTQFLPLGLVGSTDKLTVKFQQAVGGVPVEGGFVNVLFSSRGELLSIQTRALPGIAGLDTTAHIVADEAALRGVAQFQMDQGVVGSVSEEPRLVIAQVESAEARTGVLAWRVNVLYLPHGLEPLGTTYFLDAKSGAVVAKEEAIHYFDVGGTVYTMASPGTNPDVASNPETQQPMRYARVTSSAGTTFTNANGFFNYVGAASALNCTFNYSGTYNQVNNSPGGAYSLVQSVPVGTANNIVLNPGVGALETAQANVFQSVNVQRDWVRSVNPTDSKADFVHTANANIASTCNAFFNGSSINFYQAGGGCVNTGYSTVVAHEDGHWLNVIYGTGNGNDGMGEGNADVWAMYIWDNPVVGAQFINGGAIRTGLNTNAFCGDSSPACYGEVHADGEPWMGAAWKVRANLKTALGTGPGGAVANAIFLGWMNSYNQTQIRSIIETQWLTLDDNDGNIANGTPHYTQIDAGFRAQGFPGYTLIPLGFTNVTDLPDTTNQAGPYVVNATIASNFGSSVASATVFYRIGSTGSFTALPMTQGAGNNFSAAIPGQIAPKVVQYYVSASDLLGNTGTFPTSAPAQGVLDFQVGAVVVVFCDNFETNLNWAVTNTSVTSGAWTRAAPIGTTQGGVQAQPATDNPAGTGTQCMFTGQGTAGSTNVGEADVDGGPTVVTSPAFDVSSGIGQISYSYWLYNDDGDADYLKVEVASNAAGTNWVTARNYTNIQGGWRTDTINIGSYVTPTATVRVRFSCSDNPNNSVTEAAIDDVCVSTLGPIGCQGNVATYCTAKLNSLFCLPAINFDGIPSASANLPFTITAANVLNNRTGLLYYGYNTKSASFQGGTLCVESPLRRTPVQNTGGAASGNSCTGTMTFDMNALIQSGGDSLLIPGQFACAQYYYRDPADPFTTGLTNAVSFTICP
ncbi:MAG: hypothetical protein NTV21_12945 [Planctomycetota bacterium]|nr:hypothetical protein [Planctomycetota bacterium]